MIVYRVGLTRFAEDLSGTGARLNGARWNEKMVPCVYTSESRALAVLEFSVNVNIEKIIRAMSVTAIEIPTGNILELSIADLPGNWHMAPAPPETQRFGSALLKAVAAPVIRIPSTVIPEEYNYILNPVHPDSREFRIVSVRDFVYDVRIKLS